MQSLELYSTSRTEPSSRCVALVIIEMRNEDIVHERWACAIQGTRQACEVMRHGLPPRGLISVSSQGLLHIFTRQSWIDVSLAVRHLYEIHWIWCSAFHAFPDDRGSEGGVDIKVQIWQRTSQEK